ncbi:MAG TPA: MOSC domain-containing protein [Streptosporangiaceae bacterium]|nr:MOSC domain-containing protein [Streptosporangiaceae bacterium]
MPSAHIVSVNAGAAKPVAGLGDKLRTAIDKRPVRGRMGAGRLGLDGDVQVDKEFHGGPDQALYAYAREDLDWWTEQTSREWMNGMFGENLTTSGLDISGAFIGEVWQLGLDAVVQITAPRIPCRVFAAWTDERHWIKRFAAAGRPGAYLRVLAGGEVGAGDTITVLSRPERRVTITESMRAFYGDQELMRVLLTVEGRGAKWDSIGASVLGRARV